MRGFLAPRSRGYLALLIALSSFGPLSMSIYSPVMPLIERSLSTGPDGVKLTLTTYMVGFALGQLFYGPLSDRFGRRPVLIAGLIAFAVTSLGCAFAGAIGELVTLRLFQGLGAASGSVLGRALVRDAYEYREMPRIMSWISLGVNIAPAIAPSIGGLLAESFGWQGAFWVLAGVSAFLFVVVAAALPETNKARAATLDVAGVLRGSGEMLHHPQFRGYCLTMGFAFGIVFGMVAASPFILQTHLGVSPTEFGLYVLLSVAGFTAGGFVNNRLIGKVATGKIVCAATLCHVGGLLVMAGLAYANVMTPLTVMVPYMICSFGSGIVVPNANAGTVGLFPRLAGTASSLVGVAQMGVGALGTLAVALATGVGGHEPGVLPLVGRWLGCRTMACAVPMPMIAAMLPFAFAAVASAFWFLRDVRTLSPTRPAK